MRFSRGATIALPRALVPPQDPTKWFNDLSVYIDDRELITQATALESTLLHGRSRVGCAVWISLVSIIAGAFGGFTFSDEVSSSWVVFAGYVVGGALLVRVLHPLGKRLVGPTVSWQALFSFFWSFLLAMVVVLGSRIDTTWLSYTVVVGGGLFIGVSEERQSRCSDRELHHRIDSLEKSQ